MSIRSFAPMQFFVLALIIISSGCAQKSKNMQTLLKNLDDGMLESIETIKKSNTAIYESIKIKSADPSTSGQAIIALYKADSVRNKTERIRSFFLHLKRKINEDKFAMNDADLSAKVFEQIRNHKKYLIGVDSLFGIAATSKQLKLSHFETKGLRLFEQNLIGIDKPYQSLFLDKLSADAVIDENTLLNNLHNQIRVIRRCVFKWPIISINASVISVGDPVEFTAAIGYFEFVPKSKLIVDGTIVYPSDNGMFEYKYQPQWGVGKRNVPVKISYTDQDGNEQTQEVNMSITVE